MRLATSRRYETGAKRSQQHRTTTKRSPKHLPTAPASVNQIWSGPTQFQPSGPQTTCHVAKTAFPTFLFYLFLFLYLIPPTPTGRYPPSHPHGSEKLFGGLCRCATVLVEVVEVEVEVVALVAFC